MHSSLRAALRRQNEWPSPSGCGYVADCFLMICVRAIIGYSWPQLLMGRGSFVKICASSRLRECCYRWEKMGGRWVMYLVQTRRSHHGDRHETQTRALSYFIEGGRIFQITSIHKTQQIQSIQGVRQIKFQFILQLQVHQYDHKIYEHSLYNIQRSYMTTIYTFCINLHIYTCSRLCPAGASISCNILPVYII